MFGKLSIAALVSALAISAAAAPAPAPSGDQAPAAPATQDKAPDMQGVSSPTNRIVNSVNCTKGFQHSGSLSVDGKGAVSMQGNPQVLTLGGDALKVHFSECTSETMNNKELAPQDAKSHNGLIQAGDKCLRASRLGENDATLVLADCDRADDSGQFTQFWAFDGKSVSLLGTSIGTKPAYVTTVKDKQVVVSPQGDKTTALMLD